jgi:2'-5' RNA ligase
MSDIVARLRRWMHAIDAVPASDLMDEAADEITRLRLVEVTLSRFAKFDKPVAWRAFDADGSEAVYSLYEQARAAADEWNWSVEPLYRTPQPHATPGEDTSQAGCIDRTQTGEK